MHTMIQVPAGTPDAALDYLVSIGFEQQGECGDLIDFVIPLPLSSHRVDIIFATLTKLSFSACLLDEDGNTKAEFEYSRGE